MIVYLNLTEFADRLRIGRDTLAKYRLPDADAMIGGRRGWLESTIDLWNESRPGRGNWGTRAQHLENFPPPIRPGAYVKMNDGVPGERDVPVGAFPEWDNEREQQYADRLFEGPEFIAPK